MKKVILVAILMLGVFVMKSNAQVTGLIDEQNVTVTMDLQPVLQLNLLTPDMVNFTFNQISQYYGGEVQYAASILTVSSTVSWDLWAVGTSQNTLGNYWDQQMQYGTVPVGSLAQIKLPLSLLELYQHQVDVANQTAETGNWANYGTAFAPSTGLVPGQNSVYESQAAPYTAPTNAQKYIMGMAGTGAGNCEPGGSYLNQGANTDYYITIDYRILPGLPAIFPAAGLNNGTAEDLVTLDGAGSYAQPGVYTMDVKYILAEDQ